jgi:drug/metabolite transporter (DMT)-like permease
MQTGLAYLAVAVAAMLWGANFNLSKHVLADMNALVAAAARFDIAALVMLALASFRGSLAPLLRHVRAYATLGVVGIAGFNVLFFLGMQQTSAVNGALIMALNPLLTAVLAYFMTGGRPNSRQLIAFPVGVVGVAIVVLGGGASLRLAPGDALMLAANLCWAAYNVLVGRMLPRGVDGVANTTGVMLTGALTLTLVAVVAGAPVSVPHGEAAGALAAMALGGTVLAYLFWNAGIARFGAVRTAQFLNLVPVTTMTIAAIEGQMPTLAQLGGGLLVIVAVRLATMAPRAGKPATEAAAGAPRLCEARGGER